MPNARNFSLDCVVCGDTFAGYTPNAKYCSHSCRLAAKRPPRCVRPCAQCGRDFAPQHGLAMYCGEQCKQDAIRIKHRVASRRYVERHPDQRAQTRKRAWEKLRADPERYSRFLANGRKSYARHPETGYIYALNWRGKNRERIRATNRVASRQRWSLIKTADTNFKEVADFALTLRSDPCGYCGARPTVVDHIVPLAGGGSHSADNLAAACRRCNARKRITPLLFFLLKRADASSAA